MNSFMDDLIIDVTNSNDVFDVCRVLADASFGVSYRLSDGQFQLLLSMFTEAEFASALLMFLHQFEEFNEDFEKIKILYNVIHDKFEENNTIFGNTKNILA
jgi:hypothetical protein